MSIKHYASIIVIENRITYILEIGIPDFLSRNMRDNRLPQTSPLETDMAMWGDWESETHVVKRNTCIGEPRYNEVSRYRKKCSL